MYGKRGRIHLGRGTLGFKFICKLTFLKTADGCVAVAFSVALSRSEICPNLKKIRRGDGPNIWNFFKGKR